MALLFIFDEGLKNQIISSQLDLYTNGILIRMQAKYFEDTKNLILKFLWKCKGARITDTVLRKIMKLNNANYMVQDIKLE